LFDFDFESPTPVGFFVGSSGGNNFTVGLDPTVAHPGKQSLRSLYVGPPIPSKDDVAAACAGVVAQMEASRERYTGAGFAATDVDWATQNARIVAQAADLARNSAVRDPDMAQNVEWIVNQAPPGKRVVLWAHNYHVYLGTGAMGSYLSAKYGQDYVVLGFAFHAGSYNAVGTNGLGPYPATASFPGSAQYVFHGTGMPQFIVDLRRPRRTIQVPRGGWAGTLLPF